ncbi:uncharacterized protein LOC134533319 [Bacillus rossius redtenbacheri]|uniref:uncharacterized protein LOC134533319 n=1 Tax=Bacillus rossius redtenbacheri TaxID=93214 RepID=UPI002FDDE99A
MAATEESMSRLLRLARKFNCFYVSGLHKGDCLPFVVEGHQVGLVRPDVLRQLLCFPDIFLVQPDAVELNPAFRDYSERTARLEGFLRQCRALHVFVALQGWRDECYEVKPMFSKESLLKMDRSATCLFGVCNYGVGINGYVQHPDQGLCIWLQRRSPTKQTWPGKLDNMVGGGLSVGYGVVETAHKEAAEEASLTAELLRGLRPAGCVSFFFESERGLFPNTEFVFDLELPTEFVPYNTDGEVESFVLLPVAEALEKVFSSEFKTTSCPVVIDFLIRHGVITADNEPNLPSILELLHVPLQTLYQSHARRPPAENGQRLISSFPLAK